MPETIESRIRAILADNFGVEESAKGDSRFIEDLGLDSLDTVELVMHLEDEFNIQIDDDQADDMETVQQAVALVGKLTGNGSK